MQVGDQQHRRAWIAGQAAVELHAGADDAGVEHPRRPGLKCLAQRSHIDASVGNGWPGAGSCQSPRSSPATTSSRRSPGPVPASGVPGTHRSSSSALVVASTQVSNTSTAPRPAQARSPSASHPLSAWRQPTLSTTSRPRASRAGATHDTSPPGR